jgi:hypothetical protein
MASKIQLTKEEMKKEIVQCGRDPAYFLKHYAYISSPVDGRLILFDTFDFQDTLLQDFNNHRFNIINKSRQLGISTIAAGYITWMMMFHRQKNILVIATKLDTAANLVKKVKIMIKGVPEWMKIAKIKTDNKNSFELDNGSQIKASASSPDAGRSEALSLLVIDEAAHIDDLDELWAAVYPTISTGGRCIALSSPNGIGNWFHETFVDAEEGKNLFKPTHLPWQVHPKRDDQWFVNETKNMNARKIAQEYECAFNGSGDTLIDTEKLRKIEKQVSEPAMRTYIDRNLHIWKDYSSEGSYVLSADVARGDGADYSVFHVIETKTMEQVAEYQGKIDLDGFAKLIAMTARDYGNCLVCVENNNIGYSVLTKLIETGYPNIFYSTRTIDATQESVANYVEGTIPGFATTMKTRPLIIAKFDEYIRNDALKINSKRLFRELETFIWHNGRPQAAKNRNDDLIMAMAIACWIRDTAIVQNQREVESKRVMLGIMTTSSKQLNTTIGGMVYYENNVRMDAAKQDYLKNLWFIKG